MGALDGLSDFQRDWVQSARPLLLVDEVRYKDERIAGEVVTFAFLETDTARAYDFAANAQALRGLHLDEGHREVVFKGSVLYGSRARRSHDPFREYVTASVGACRTAFFLTTTSAVLKRYETLAPGGIRADPGFGETRGPSKVMGPELVPVMNMTKVVALRRSFGPVQIDVLLDRSARLGIDPRQRALEDSRFESFGPGEFNETSSGAPAAVLCPTRFRLVAGDDDSGFRDLLLLPDAVAYVGWRSSTFKPAVDAVVRGEDFFVQEADASKLFTRAAAT